MEEYYAVMFMFEHGLRWAIGNGEVVRIWKDIWLPRPLTFKILTPATPTLGELMVKNIISMEDMCWKIDLLHQLFAKEEGLYGYSPNKDQPDKEGIMLETSCPRCGAVEETAHHVLRDYNFSRAVWFTAPVGMGTFGSHDVSSKKWLFQICENKQVDFEVVLLLMMIWALWKEMNGVVWDGHFFEPLEVVQRTLSWLYGFQVANQPSQVEEPKHLRLSFSDQWFKLNVDSTVKLKD
ncbi:uncharacterized protein [Malus domestica]|uniref:uncharacterized protein n=1 Tax=Malus domestica TaxID=3750 RepID=UPI000499083F|nr:uncharacterized protein LOC103450176 [Malus domestica]